MRFSSLALLVVVLTALVPPRIVLAQRGVRQRRRQLLAPKTSGGDASSAVSDAVGDYNTTNTTTTTNTTAPTKKADKVDNTTTTTTTGADVADADTTTGTNTTTKGSTKKQHPAAPVIGDTIGDFVEAALGNPEAGDDVGDTVTDILNTDLGQAILDTPGLGYLVGGEGADSIGDVIIGAILSSDAPSMVPSGSPVAETLPTIKQKRRRRLQRDLPGEPSEFFEAVGGNTTVAKNATATAPPKEEGKVDTTGGATNTTKSTDKEPGPHPAAPLIGSAVGQFVEAALDDPEVGAYVGGAVTDILNSDVGQAILNSPELGQLVGGEDADNLGNAVITAVITAQIDATMKAGPGTTSSIITSDAPSIVPSDAPSGSPVTQTLPTMKQKRRHLQSGVGTPKNGTMLGDQIGELVGKAVGNPDVGEYVGNATAAFFKSDVGQDVLNSPEISLLLGGETLNDALITAVVNAQIEAVKTPKGTGSDAPSMVPSDTPSSSPVVSQVSKTGTGSDAPSMVPSSIPVVAKNKGTLKRRRLQEKTPVIGFAPAFSSDAPSSVPSDVPSDMPSDFISDMPSDAPSDMISDVPSDVPSDAPSTAPTAPLPDKLVVKLRGRRLTENVLQATVVMKGNETAVAASPVEPPVATPTEMKNDQPLIGMRGNETEKGNETAAGATAPEEPPVAAPTKKNGDDEAEAEPVAAPTTKKDKGSAADFFSVFAGAGESLSDAPSLVPSDAPSSVPSDSPSLVPSDAPSMVPSTSPSQVTAKGAIPKPDKRRRR